MTSEPNDPRVYFAAERTLLAWLRTGLAVVGVGFLVARFGWFLAMVRKLGDEVPPPPLFSTLIGIGFVLLGALLMGAAAWQHVGFCRELSASQRPARYWLSLGGIVSAVLTLLSIALAVYLLQSYLMHQAAT